MVVEPGDDPFHFEELVSSVGEHPPGDGAVGVGRPLVSRDAIGEAFGFPLEEVKGREPSNLFLFLLVPRKPGPDGSDDQPEHFAKVDAVFRPSEWSSDPNSFKTSAIAEIGRGSAAAP